MSNLFEIRVRDGGLERLLDLDLDVFLLRGVDLLLRDLDRDFLEFAILNLENLK